MFHTSLSTTQSLELDLPPYCLFYARKLFSLVQCVCYSHLTCLFAPLHCCSSGTAEPRLCPSLVAISATYTLWTMLSQRGCADLSRGLGFFQATAAFSRHTAPCHIIPYHTIRYFSRSQHIKSHNATAVRLVTRCYVTLCSLTKAAMRQLIGVPGHPTLYCDDAHLPHRMWPLAFQQYNWWMSRATLECARPSLPHSASRRYASSSRRKSPPTEDTQYSWWTSRATLECDIPSSAMRLECAASSTLSIRWTFCQTSPPSASECPHCLQCSLQLWLPRHLSLTFA